MSVSGGTIAVSKTTSGKFFDGKENTRYSETSTDCLTGMDAVAFIASGRTTSRRFAPTFSEWAFDVDSR